VSNGEGVAGISVDGLIFSILLVEDGESESVFLFGSVRDSVGSEVLNERLLNNGFDGGGVFAHVHSEESGGGTEGVHLYLILINK